MGRGRKKKEDKTSEELTGQQMLMQITNGYIDNATDEQRRLIYECAMKILATPPEPEKPADEGGTQTGPAPESLGIKSPMRIYIRDMSGAELTKIMEFPFNEDKDILQAATMKPFGTFNLSKIPIHYYSETPPR